MAYRIVDVIDHSCHLCVVVEHLNDDGSVWFLWNYLWPGREGTRQKRQTNGSGQILMDNGEVAPFTTPVHALDVAYQYLPEGRTWAYHPAPVMVDASIHESIRLVHQQATDQAWAQGIVDTLPSISEQAEDRTGCDVLVSKFLPLKGRSF